MKNLSTVLLLSLLGSTLVVAASPGHSRDRLNERIYGRMERWFPINQGQSAESPQAFFSAFTASGAGTFGPCSSTPPTATNGAPILTTRATAGNCLKQGLALTGLLEGDLVSVPADTARVMPNFEGVLGVLVENLVTNLLLYSEQFENGAWVPYSDGSALFPVITPNVVNGLDGTLSADRMDLPATSAVQSSLIYQAVCVAGQNCSVGWFVRGVPGVSDSGTVDICAGNSGAVCAPCAFVSGSWSYCKRTGLAGSVGSVFIGNATFYNGGTTRPAQSVYIWGAHAFVNPYVAMYSKTTSSSSTVNADIVQVDVGASAPAPNAFSLAISSSGYNDVRDAAQYSAYFASNTTFFAENNPRGLWNYTNDAPPSVQRCIAGPESGVFSLTGAVALSTSTALKRAACWATGGNLMGSYNGLNMTPAPLNAGTFNAARYLNIGNSGASNLYLRPGLYSDLCFDPDSNFCR